MLAFFPTPYEDEVLYSVLARYCVRCAETSPKNALQTLYGARDITATVDLPSHIDALVNNLPIGCLITSERLINEHTLYPIYRPFLFPEQAERVFFSMKGCKGGDIHTRAGISASPFPGFKYFRFCPSCFKEDCLNHGEGYWRRLHQAPGVFICPEHFVLLSDSSVFVHGLNKHQFYAADEDNCKYAPHRVDLKAQTHENLILIARDIKWLLQTNLSPLEPGKYEQHYLALLINRGLATSTGRVYQRELNTSFMEFYGGEFLEVLYSPITFNEETNWLASIVRKHRKSFHPIRHLLLMRFLSGSAPEFFSGLAVYEPFGRGPWPCLNAAAEHYLHPVITNVKITHCFDTKRPVGTFNCSCGFIYSRRGPDQTVTDRHKIGTIKDFGPVWQEKLRHLLLYENLSLRGLARRLNVDTKTVKRHAALMVNPDFEVASVVEKPCHGQTPKVKEQGNTVKVSKNKRKESDGYVSDESSKKQRVNWGERDHQILSQVKKTVAEILSLPSKPQRITISRLGKLLNLRSLLEKKLHKLPLTREYLLGVAETVEEYQIRRAKWAIDEIRNKGEEPAFWKVMRLAGLKSNISAGVRLAICSELSTSSYGGYSTDKVVLYDSAPYKTLAFSSWGDSQALLDKFSLPAPD